MGKVTVQSHKVGSTSYRFTSLSFHVNWSSHSRDTCFYFQDLTLKIQGQGKNSRSNSWPNMLSSYRFTSVLLHVDRIPYSWNTAFSKFDLDNVKVQSHKVCPTSYRFTSTFFPCQYALLYLWYIFFNIWLWKSKVNVISPWCCTTTCLDNAIEFSV